jgi:glycine cleavage system H lipoate-binding protein
MQTTNVSRQSKQIKRDLYYTSDHEWIDFQGSVAYVGICSFKLKGIKEIQKIEFSENKDLLKNGDVIASLLYDDYVIDVHIPVNGRVIQFNDAVLTGDREIVLQQPENNGWIALVIPASPYDRKGLMISEQYRMRAKSIY